MGRGRERKKGEWGKNKKIIIQYISLYRSAEWFASMHPKGRSCCCYILHLYQRFFASSFILSSPRTQYRSFLRKSSSRPYPWTLPLLCVLAWWIVHHDSLSLFVYLQGVVVIDEYILESPLLSVEFQGREIHLRFTQSRAWLGATCMPALYIYILCLCWCLCACVCASEYARTSMRSIFQGCKCMCMRVPGLPYQFV